MSFFGGSATTQPTFGAGGGAFSGFGGQTGAQQAPTFGSFGQPQGQAQPQQQQQQQSTGGFPSFGGGTTGTSTFGGFGQPQAQLQQPQQQQQQTGFSLNPPAPTTTQFSFGQTPAPTQSSTTGFPSFGGGGTTTTTAGGGGGGFGGFGAPTPSFGGFGATTTSTAAAPSFGGFGTTTTAASTVPSFGGFGLKSGFSLAQPAAAPTSTAFSFGQPQQTGFSLGATPSLFGQPQQQVQQQPQIDENQAFQQSIFQCHKFGDERDSVLAAFNYLQSCWGSGKGFYSQTLPPANYTPTNPFYRFKAVGFAYMYTDNNEDGLVVINFKKSQQQVTSEETNIITTLQQLLNRPNILIRFSGTKAVSEEGTVVVIFAEDKNTLRRIPATDMAAALCQPHLKAQLENLGVTNVNPKVKPSPEQLKRYLETPPDGIDPRVWTKAQEDNPDPKSMIPIPLVGVEALKSRTEWQEKETLQHHARLKLIGDDVSSLLNRHANLTAELQQMRRKHTLLTHRLISIICRQELMRKVGTTLHPDEEVLKKKLEEMDSQLNLPTKYKGRLNELLSQIRLHKSMLENSRSAPRYNIEPTSLTPVKEFLGMQQESVKHLVATVKKDQESVKEMTECINEILKLF